MKEIIVAGQRYGLLVALQAVADPRWLFKCDCGETKAIRTRHVFTGATRSCGCLRRRKTGAQSCHPREYGSYASMRARCLNPANRKYARYGGRGIKICDRWLAGFSNFLADMGARPPGTTLDRRDNDGDYTPENCRWATPLQQSNNRSFIRPTAGCPSLKALARQEGVAYHSLHYHVVRRKKAPGEALAFLHASAAHAHKGHAQPRGVA